MVMTAPEPPSGAPRSPSEPAPQIPPLMRHKVTPPLLDAQALQRPRLLRALDQAATNRLTIIAAPAGYGKTTLLSAWASTYARPTQGRPATGRYAWLSLGREENDPDYLAALFAAALIQGGLPLSWPPQPICEDENSARLSVAWALNAVAASDEPLTLVLDGYDALSSPAAHDLVGFMLDHGPPGLRLVVAGRSEPPLPLARLRARRQLAELRSDDLRWNVAEAGMFLNDRLGLGLGPEQVSDLVERTEGWVAGLSLAALVLEGRPEAGVDLAGHRFLADYLLGEVLEREPEAAQGFLLQAALLDELSGPLVEALLLTDGSDERAALLAGFPSGQAALEAIARRGLFLYPIEGRPGWYRFHRLFAATLQAQLRQRMPESAGSLAERAAALRRREALRQPARPRQLGQAGLAEPLSEREHETLTLIAAGKPNREIAALLSISESTVKSHLKHIFAKLNARNRTESVAIARELRILEP